MLCNAIHCISSLSSGHRLFGDKKRFRVLPLHGSLATQEQQLVFESTPRGVQKIVLSTNIAETSVTIDDIVFVIDCGKMKEKHYDSAKVSGHSFILYVIDSCHDLSDLGMTLRTGQWVLRDKN